MFRQLNTYLKEFSACFSRTAAFNWFVTVVVGFIVRRDVRGLTSLVRCLNLCPKLYEAMLCFFRASSWSLGKLQQCWVNVICKHCHVVTFNGFILLVGDGIKVVKEAKKMPAVKKLHQESENSGKASCIFGHHFGFIGILVGNLKKYFCTPVAAEIHEGVGEIHQFEDDKSKSTANTDKDSVVTRTLLMAKRITGYLSKACILILDAYYATGPAFKIAVGCIDQCGNQMLHIITKAKMNTVAYEDPKPRTGLRGRPPVRGEKVDLIKLFTTQADKFQPLFLDIYGKSASLSYLCLDLIWRPIMKKVRIILVKNGSGICILMSSNLNLLPYEIIQHFWTRAMPKLNRKTPRDLSIVTDEHQQQLIVKATKAIEGFVNIGCISIGLLQILAINFSKNIWSKYTGWLRTKTSEIPTEETVCSVLQQEFYYNFCNYSDTATFKIITAKQRKQTCLYDDEYEDEAV